MRRGRDVEDTRMCCRVASSREEKDDDVRVGSQLHEAWRIFARESVSVEVSAMADRAARGDLSEPSGCVQEERRFRCGVDGGVVSKSV